MSRRPAAGSGECGGCSASAGRLRGAGVRPPARRHAGPGPRRPETALALLDRVAAIGDRFGDPDLLALTRHAQGRTLIRSGKVTEGVALLDEAMVAVTTDEVTPLVVGGVYCSVVSGCQEIFDWRRAQEWTAAMSAWAAPQDDLVLFRGQCLLRRSEVLQLRGDWAGAQEEARRALARFLDPPGQPRIGDAYVQMAELHRLHGELAEAEENYRLASQHGKRIQPGLALIRMAQGDPAAALASLRHALDESPERRFRPMLLAAAAEAAIAAGDVPAARNAAEELATIAGDIVAPYLRALSARAGGAVRLAEGDARGALRVLRESEAIWQELEAPYEAARTRCSSAAPAWSWGCVRGGDESRGSGGRVRAARRRARSDAGGAIAVRGRAIERLCHPERSEGGHAGYGPLHFVQGDKWRRGGGT